MTPSGMSNHDVDLVVDPHGGLYDGIPSFCHIAVFRHSLSPLLLDLLHDFISLCAVRVIHHDLAATRGKQKADRASQTTATVCDEGHAIVVTQLVDALSLLSLRASKARIHGRLTARKVAAMQVQARVAHELPLPPNWPLRGHRFKRAGTASVEGHKRIVRLQTQCLDFALLCTEDLSGGFAGLMAEVGHSLVRRLRHGLELPLRRAEGNRPEVVGHTREPYRADRVHCDAMLVAFNCQCLAHRCHG
mmetsp:Transcript_78167/g.181380  ORF Transcript_78167/g.181380 Transcript_78167/m.181380 type:complete len:247 (-) Transcript_78167:2262-3002(-)